MIFSLFTYAGNPLRTLDPALNCSLEKVSLFHNDSVHSLNFKYADRKRGLKPYIAPAVLIASGTALHFSDSKYRFNDWVQDNFRYEGSLDDYLRYAPLAAVYGLNAIGIKGKNNFGNLTAIS